MGLRKRWWRSGWVLGVAASLVMGLGAMRAGAAEEPGKVKLVYAFSPGQALEYDITISGSGTTVVTPKGAMEPGEKIPMTMTGTMAMTQKVVQMYDDGSAALEMLMGDMDMHMVVEAKGNRQEMDIKMTKDRMILSGPQGKQEIDLESSGIGAAMMREPMRVRMTPQGKIEWVSAQGMQQLSKMTGMDLSQMMVSRETPFPDREIGPGETWEYETEFPVPRSETEAKLKMKAELVSLEGAGASRVAEVTTKGEVDLSGMSVTTQAPQGPQKITFDSLKEALLGRFSFDLGRGVVTQATYDMTMAVEMQTPGEQGGQVTSDMTMQVGMRLK